MIKRILILAVVRLLSAALSVGAASVTPSSANDYIFTTPLFPDSIRGEVMGDPPAYYDPRGEDFDWLFEAYSERLALINGSIPSQTDHLEPSFGKWPLAATNYFHQWSTAVDASGGTNVVVGYNIVTNAQRPPLYSQDAKQAYETIFKLFTGNKLGYQTGISSGRFLDGNAPLIGEARVAHDYYDEPSFTNATFSISWTNSLVTNVTYITMPMTNGNTSVFTNRWTATFVHPITNSVTNVVAAVPLDYCHAGDGTFPGFTNGISLISRFDPPNDGSLAMMYDALRSAVRLADTKSPTNNAIWIGTSESIYEKGEDLPPITITGFVQYAEYEIYGSRDYVIDDQFHDNPTIVDDYVYRSISSTSTYEAISPTRFKSDLVTTGGANRVEIKAAFAIVEFSHSSGHLDISESIVNPDYIEDVYIHKIVVVPLASYSIDVSHKDALARVILDSNALCTAASSATGAPSPPSSLSGVYPPPYESQHWKAKCNGIVLIYKITPSSKINGW